MGYVLCLLDVLSRHVFLTQVLNHWFVFEFLEAYTFFKDLVEIGLATGQELDCVGLNNLEGLTLKRCD